MSELQLIASLSEVETSWDLAAYFFSGDCQVNLERYGLHGQRLKNLSRTVSRGGSFQSRSYTHGFKADIAWTGKCAIDIELVNEAPAGWDIHNPSFQSSILKPGEYQRLCESPNARANYLPTLIWSSKEALAKALGDARDYEPRHLDSPLLWNADDSNWDFEYRIFRVGNRELLLCVVREKSKP